MLVLTANKAKMLRLVRDLGYNPGRQNRFSKVPYRRSWFLEWHDDQGYYRAIYSAAAGRAFLGMTRRTWGGPEQWESQSLSIEQLREYGMVEELAPKAQAPKASRRAAK